MAGGTMETAKLFVNGRSQAVRLPKAFRFEGNEVYLKKTSKGVLLIPKENTIWEIWEKELMAYDEPFMEDRHQPEPQQRTGLDDLFV
jgi:antitoxin VapB